MNNKDINNNQGMNKNEDENKQEIKFIIHLMEN